MPNEPFIGELRPMSFDFPPKGWAQCNGQLLQVSQFQNLFGLLGTFYGGDGKTTFGLPDLRSRAPIGYHPAYPMGSKIGREFHTLTQQEMPAHSHQVMASSSVANQAMPAILASTDNTFRTADDLIPLHLGTLSQAGGDKPHENRHSYSVLNWCIALQGITPRPA
ncbi:MAG TPA: tail fiber protein [Solirubrobacterales bacterium]|nr:tail fiber protein [Solirubrobacterales bacterium]